MRAPTRGAPCNCRQDASDWGSPACKSPRAAQKLLATAKVIFAHIEDTLNSALTLVGRCDEVYRLGGPQVRRLSNQFFFEKLLITENTDEGAQVVGAILQEP